MQRPPRHRPRHTPRRPWAPLSDDEWGALWPYVAMRAPQGRRVGDLRQRMDAISHMACRGYHISWRKVPDVYGKGDTVSRFFRRLTHRGLWHHLVKVLGRGDICDKHPLWKIEHYIVRACRRAARLGGLRLIFLIKRLGLHSALNAPAWYLPDQQLSELIPRLAPALHPDPDPGERWRDARRRIRTVITHLKRLHRMAGGRARIPRSLRLAWP